MHIIEYYFINNLIQNPQQNQLCELLNNYTKNGVPQSKSSCSNFNNPEYLEALESLENLPTSWTDIVKSGGKCFKYILH